MKTKTSFSLVLFFGAATSLWSIPMDRPEEPPSSISFPLRAGARTDSDERDIGTREEEATLTAGNSNEQARSSGEAFSEEENRSTASGQISNERFNSVSINPPVALSVPGSLVIAEAIAAEDLDGSDNITTIPTLLASIYISPEVAIAAEHERQRMRFEQRKQNERIEDEPVEIQREELQQRDEERMAPRNLFIGTQRNTKADTDIAHDLFEHVAGDLNVARRELAHVNHAWLLSSTSAIQAVEDATISLAEATTDSIDKNRIHRIATAIRSSEGIRIDQTIIPNELYFSWEQAEEAFYLAVNNLLASRRAQQQASRTSWLPWKLAKSPRDLDLIATEAENCAQLAESLVSAIANAGADRVYSYRAEMIAGGWREVAIDARTTASRSAIRDEQEREAASRRRSPSNEREGDWNISESVLQDWRAAVIAADNDDDSYAGAWTQGAKN